MPNTKQNKKRTRLNERRREENKVVRSAMRSATKRVLEAETPEAASQHLPDALKKVDKAAKRNVIHKNTAARKKSRLSRAARAEG